MNCLSGQQKWLAHATAIKLCEDHLALDDCVRLMDQTDMQTAPCSNHHGFNSSNLYAGKIDPSWLRALERAPTERRLRYGKACVIALSSIVDPRSPEIYVVVILRLPFYMVAELPSSSCAL